MTGDPALRAQRQAQDRVLRERHRQWDLAAQDRTPKAHRHHFAVGGQGSRTAQDNFRRGYGLIDWSQ